MPNEFALKNGEDSTERLRNILIVFTFFARVSNGDTVEFQVYCTKDGQLKGWL